MKNRYGFTVIESLMVLALTTLSLGLVLFIKNSSPTEFINQVYFWRQFRSRFDWLESISSKDKIPTLITFPTNKKVIFSFKRNNIVLRAPQGLKIAHRTMVDPPVIRINRTGNVHPRTIYWLDKLHHRNIAQIFELGWGVYRLKKD